MQGCARRWRKPEPDRLPARSGHRPRARGRRAWACAIPWKSPPSTWHIPEPLNFPTFPLPIPLQRLLVTERSEASHTNLDKREELPRHATDSRTSGRLPRELDPVSLPSFRRALCSARMCSEILPAEPRPMRRHYCQAYRMEAAPVGRESGHRTAGRQTRDAAHRRITRDQSGLPEQNSYKETLPFSGRHPGCAVLGTRKQAARDGSNRA